MKYLAVFVKVQVSLHAQPFSIYLRLLHNHLPYIYDIKLNSWPIGMLQCEVSGCCLKVQCYLYSCVSLHDQPFSIYLGLLHLLPCCNFKVPFSHNNPIPESRQKLPRDNCAECPPSFPDCSTTSSGLPGQRP